MPATYEPDDEEIMQEEGDTTAHVTVDGPVRTVELPSKSGGSRFYTVPQIDGVAPGEPFQILGKDPRRKKVLLQVNSGTLAIGTTKNEVSGMLCARFLVGTPLPLTMSDEIWVGGVGGVASVSILAEQWTS